MYGIIDCDNCYVSCERVFRPDLKNKPVVVLSNNDGCVVARSNEAKRLGIKAGMPFYQMEELLRKQHPELDVSTVAVFSSNYELYGELTGRVVEMIRKEVPTFFRYSIDECFVYLDGMENQNLKAWGEDLHRRIRQSVGMPVSIGIATNKTLAKIASHFAKHYPGYRHCCMIDTDEKRTKALKLLPIGEVWGIGRRQATKMQALGISTAHDFAQHSLSWLRAALGANIVMLRTWRELNGEDCVPNEAVAKKKSICTSRSFSHLISDIGELSTHVSNYASRCAEKLRKQGSAATVIGLFLTTNPFREDLPQYWNYQETILVTPTNSTITLVNEAQRLLRQIFQPGYSYKKAGVTVTGIVPGSEIQQDLFGIAPERYLQLQRIDTAADRINKNHGSETIVLAAQQYTHKSSQSRSRIQADKFADAIRHDYKTPNPTTRWSEIIKLK